MENTGSILALAFTALVVAYFGYRIKKERQRLRETVGLLGDDDLQLIQSVEQLVLGGKLAPVSVRQA